MITLTVPLSGFSPTMLEWGGVQRPALGGKTTRVNRLGSRFAAQFAVPTMSVEQGRGFVADLLRARFEGASVALPLGYERQGAPGKAAVAASAVSGGTSVPLEAVNPGWVAKKGYWLNVTDGVDQFLHQIAETVVTPSTGIVTLTIVPELRVSLADGSAVNLAAPVINGWVADDSIAWDMSLSRHLDFGFTVEESR